MGKLSFKLSNCHKPLETDAINVNKLFIIYLLTMSEGPPIFLAILFERVNMFSQYKSR